MRLRNILVFSLFACFSLLSGLPRAYAGHWTEPVYDVPTRTPASAFDDGCRGLNTGTGIPIQTAYPGCAQVVGGTGTSGTITAKFTWVPDNGQTLTTDPPPQRLSILESPSATWTAPLVENPGGGHPHGIPNYNNPSDSSDLMTAVWKRGGKSPRIMRVQAQGGGSADDGMGDPEVRSGNPTIGTSSGHWIRTYTVPADGVVTTDPVALVATAPTGGNTQWTFTAAITEFNITCNGTDITDPQPPKDVMVGQHISLVANIPTNLGVIDTASETWTVGGNVSDRIKYYTQILQTGHAEPFHPEDLIGHESVSFYWINGSFDGAISDVTFAATIGSQTYHLKGKVRVFRPKVDFFHSIQTVEDTPVHVGASAVRVPVSMEGKTVLGFGATTAGPYTPGENFESSVTTPDVQIAEGQISLVQLTNIHREIGTGGITIVVSSAGILDGFVLDDAGGASTSGIVDYGGTVVTIGNKETKEDNDQDSPLNVIDDGDTTSYASDQFRTYITYKPAGTDSVRVALGFLSWFWSGSASKHQFVPPYHWSLDSDALGNLIYTPKQALGLIYVDSTAQPEWGNYKSGLHPTMH